MNRGRRSYRRCAAATVAAAALFVPGPAALADDNPRLIDRGEYAARLRAMWIGNLIANWTGVRTEGQFVSPPFLTDADWNGHPFPDRPWVTIDLNLYGNPWPADDNSDIWYVYVHTLHTLGVNRLTPEQIAQAWTDHINSYIWVSNYSARALIGEGIRPPMTALAQGLDAAAPNDQSLEIDAQITTEVFGALCPGMPERALAMADLPIRTTASGYAVHAAQFHVALFSLASQVDRSLAGRDQALWLVREARKYISDSSKTADVIDFVVADVLANPDASDWESTRDRIYQRYQASAGAHGFVYRNWFESSINLAAGVMQLLYGGIDFQRTVQIGTLAGWDSDCPTATMGALVALVQGQDFLAQYGWVNDNYWITRTRDNLPDYTPGPVFDGEDTFTLMGRRMLPIIDREVADAGGLVYAAPGTIPTGQWLLPPGGAGPGISAPVALSRSPTQREFARSANWRVRAAGGSVTPSSSVPGSPAADFGSGDPVFIADGLEHDWRGLEEPAPLRWYYSTQRAGGNPPGVPQTISVVYDRPVEVHTIRFIGGQIFAGGAVEGGWFQTIAPQVLVAGQWVSPALSSAPVPPSHAGFPILEFVLASPAQATGIRVTGIPGGSSAFITCMELDALSAPPPLGMPTFGARADGRSSVDDLYAFAAHPADLNADGAANDVDAAYLELAVRWRELAGMARR